MHPTKFICENAIRLAKFFMRTLLSFIILQCLFSTSAHHIYSQKLRYIHNDNAIPIPILYQTSNTSKNCKTRRLYESDGQRILG